MHEDNKIIIYSDGDKKVHLEVTLKGDSIWLTQAQLALLFETERSVVTKHLRNIFNSGELLEKSNVQKMHIASSDKPVKLYNLDAIISVGYRVSSKRATQFRMWATGVLREHIMKGYTVNKKRPTCCISSSSITRLLTEISALRRCYLFSFFQKIIISTERMESERSTIMLLSRLRF